MTEPAITTTDLMGETIPPTTDEASTNAYWTYGKEQVFNLQTTVRGAMAPWQIEMHLASVKHTLAAIVKMGGHAKAVGHQPQPAPTATAPAPAPVAAPGAPVPAPVSSATTGPTQTNGNGIQTLLATRLEVTPRSDGKVDAKFFEAGHKYPDLYMTRPAAELAAALAGAGAWKPEHFAAAASYDVKLNVEYRLSEKLNKNGKAYKDIMAIKAA